MAHKIFYVTRTEDEEQGRAGPASLLRADDPQLMKTYDTKADIIADDENIEENEIVGSEENDFTDIAITNTVEDENMNPVTSNAVYNKTKDMVEYPPAPTTFTVVASSTDPAAVNVTYTVEERGWYLMQYNAGGTGSNSKVYGSISVNGVELQHMNNEFNSIKISSISGSLALPLNVGDYIEVECTWKGTSYSSGFKRILRFG